MENDLKKKENKINKLLTEYKRKIQDNQNELNILLIDFAREYNNIWGK